MNKLKSVEFRLKRRDSVFTVPDFCEEGPIATRQSVVVRLGLFGWWRSGEAAVGAWNAFSLEFEFDSMNVFAWVRCLIILRVGTRTVLSHDIYLVEATRRRVDLINTPRVEAE
jgi:hypothetical protein